MLRLQLLVVCGLLATSLADHGGLVAEEALEHLWHDSETFKVGSVPVSINKAVAVSIPSRETIYIFGGCLDADCTEYNSDVFEFDVHTETATKKATWTSPRTKHSAALLGNKIYLFGGVGKEAGAVQVDVFDIEQDAFLSSVEPTVEILDSSAFTLGGKAYFAGGEDKNGDIVDKVYSVGTDGAVDVESDSLKAPRSRAGAAVVGNTAYIVGGIDGNKEAVKTMLTMSSSGNIKEFQDSAHELRVEREYPSVASLNGRVYVFGGEKADATEYKIVEIFSPKYDHFMNGGRLADVPKDNAVAAMEDRIYFFGGVKDNEAVSTFIDYEERTDIYSLAPLQLHGSGTSNPSYFYWSVLHKLETRTRIPLSVSYRSVGSGTGQAEYLGKEGNYHVPYTHFGSGDIVIKKDPYDALTNHGFRIAQIPIGFGAVGVYVNIPELKASGKKLILDACQLGRIFNGEVKQWSDLGVESLSGINKDIKWVVRGDTSSSTSGFTGYLAHHRENCGDFEWPKVEKFKKPTEWPCSPNCESEFPNFESRNQSGGVQGYIESTPYSIGYLSYGHEYPDALSGVTLRDKKLGITADISLEGIKKAANSKEVTWPKSIYDTFEDVSLLNLPEEGAYPITLVTYLYVRQDLTYLGRSAAILRAFVEYILDKELGQAEIEEFNYVSLTEVPTVWELTKQVLKTEEECLKEGLKVEECGFIMPPGDFFTFEGSKNREGEGSTPYVISAKRKSHTDNELKKVNNNAKALQQQVNSMSAMQASYQAKISGIKDEFATFEEVESQVETATGIAVAALIFALFSWILNMYLFYVLFHIKKTVGRAKLKSAAKGSVLEGSHANGIEMSDNGSKNEMVQS